MSEVQESANETSQPKKETADAGKEVENPQDKETEPQVRMLTAKLKVSNFLRL